MALFLRVQRTRKSGNEVWSINIIGRFKKLLEIWIVRDGLLDPIGILFGKYQYAWCCVQRSRCDSVSGETEMGFKLLNGALCGSASAPHPSLSPLPVHYWFPCTRVPVSCAAAHKYCAVFDVTGQPNPQRLKQVSTQTLVLSFMHFLLC